MGKMNIFLRLLGAFAFIAAIIINPLTHRARVLGFTRSLEGIERIHGEGHPVIILDTEACEDLHYHAPSGLLFTACEEHFSVRFKWFPALAIFHDPGAAVNGSINVIDPKTFVSKKLALVGFTGPFVTHGIDLWSPEDEPNSIYIFAVNHLPNPEYNSGKGANKHKAQSQIEVFHHVAGTSEARYLRSIRHPLIRTPNDIYAMNATSLYITNDHFYRDGTFRLLEDIGFQSLAPWTDLIHITLADLETRDETAGITASVAKAGLHNNNGLGKGPGEVILIGQASSGILSIARPSLPPYIEVIESIQLPTTIDNPTYFADPYIASTGSDASGYIVAGLARAMTFPDGIDPAVVWMIGDPTGPAGERKPRLLFQDNGSIIQSASTAVLVAIDPKTNENRKQAHLFVTGPTSRAIVAVRINI